MKTLLIISSVLVLTGCGSMNEPYYNFGLDTIELTKLPKYNKCDYQKCNYGFDINRKVSSTVVLMP